MRCYLVSAKGIRRYAGTQAQARALRPVVADLAKVGPRSVEIDDADIPVKKEDLLDFINNLCTEADPS